MIAVLVGMKDIAPVLINESGNARDHAFAVRTTQEKNSGMFGHRRAFRSFMISRVAFAPDAPVRPVPGCVPDPHK